MKIKLKQVPIMFGANSHEGSFVYATVYNSFLAPNNYIDNEKFLRDDLVHQLLQTVEIGNSYPVEYMVQDAYFQVSLLKGIFIHIVAIQDWQMGDLELMRPGIIDMLGVFFLKVAQIAFIQKCQRFWQLSKGTHKCSTFNYHVIGNVKVNINNCHL